MSGGEKEKGVEFRNYASEKIRLCRDLISENRVVQSDGSKKEALLNLMELDVPGYVNLDYDEINLDLKESNKIIVLSDHSEGPNRIPTIIGKIIDSSLWETIDFSSVKKIIIKFLCAKDYGNSITASEFSEIVRITSSLPSNIDIKWSVGNDDSLAAKVKMIVAVCF